MKLLKLCVFREKASVKQKINVFPTFGQHALKEKNIMIRQRSVSKFARKEKLTIS